MPKEYGILFILAHVSLYIIYNNVYKKYFVISLKKVCLVLCHIVESVYLCTRKRETTQFAIEFFERFHIRH